LLMAERTEDRLWNLSSSNFSYRILPGLHFRFPGRTVSTHFNFRVIQTLRSLDPDVVISGGFAPANMMAMLYCKIFRKKFIVWGELTLRHEGEASYLKRAIRRLVGGWADGAIASSWEARDAFRHYGVDDDRILTAVMPVDVDHIHSGAIAFRSTKEFPRLRKRYQSPILLSIGQIIPRKGYRELFEIYRRLIEAGCEPSLIIIGDGPDRKKLEAEARDRGWHRVHFQGFISPDDLPKWFAIGDIFVFHTLFDPFGAVLGEAMAAELPVVSSVYAAATKDLVKEGVTGFPIDPKDADSSAAAILKVLKMEAAERAAMGRAAFAQVRRFDAKSSGELIVRFAESRLRSEKPEGKGLSPEKAARGTRGGNG